MVFLIYCFLLPLLVGIICLKLRELNYEEIAEFWMLSLFAELGITIYYNARDPYLPIIVMYQMTMLIPFVFIALFLLNIHRIPSYMKNTDIKWEGSKYRSIIFWFLRVLEQIGELTEEEKQDIEKQEKIKQDKFNSEIELEQEFKTEKEFIESNERYLNAWKNIFFK